MERVELADGRSYCIKSNNDAADMFAQEAYGLAALAQVGYLRTPQVFAVESLTADSSLEDGTSSPSGHKPEQCLVMEAIEPGKPAVDYWNCFGRQRLNITDVVKAARLAGRVTTILVRPFKRTSRAIIGWSSLASVVLDIS